MSLIPKSQDNIHPESPFKNLLIPAPCPHSDNLDLDTIDDIKHTLDPQTLLQSIGNVPLPCLYERVRRLCFDASAALEDVLDFQNVSAIPDSIDIFLTFSKAIRTSPYPLFCQRHQGRLMTEAKWSSALIEKIISYLVSGNDTEHKAYQMFIRLLEVILNPPKDYGHSNLGQEFAKQIKPELMIESPQLYKVISSIMMFLPSPVRRRMCVDLQDELIQLLDPDLVTTEMLTLLYFISFNLKADEAIIDKLLDFIVDSFNFEQGEPREEFINIAIQILLNATQRLSESVMKYLMTKLYSHAFKSYNQYKKTDILTHVISPLLNSTSFSSFVPICVHFNQNLKINYSSRSSMIENNYSMSDPGAEIHLLTPSQQQDLLNFIQMTSRGFGPFQAFDVEWQKWGIKMTPPFLGLRGSDSILMIFSYFINQSWVKLVLYIGSKLISGPVPTESIPQLTETPVETREHENLLLFCVDGEPLRLLDIKPNIYLGSSYDKFEIKIMEDKTFILKLEWNVLSIYNQNLHSLDPQYSIGKSAQPAQHIIDAYESVCIWYGSSALNLNRAQQPYGIYEETYQATRFREVFETLRPNQKIFFVPKDISIADFTTVLFQDQKDITNNLQVLYKQQVVNQDLKIRDLNQSQEVTGLFEIIDVFLSGPKDCSNMKEILIDSVLVYQKIIQQYTEAIDRPLLEYFSKYGNSLGFLSKFAMGDVRNVDPFGILKFYERINKSIGPYISMLTSIFGTDLLLMLWNVLSKGSSVDQQAVLQLIYKTILKNMKNTNLLASDPKHLHNFMLEAVECLFLNDFRFQQHFPTCLAEVKLTLNSVGDAGLIQDSEIIALIVDAIGIKFQYYEEIFYQIDKMLTKNEAYLSRINQLFEIGSGILDNYCTDQKFHRTFKTLAETIKDASKVLGYVLALSKNERFKRILVNMVADFQKQSGEEPFRIKMDPSKFIVIKHNDNNNNNVTNIKMDQATEENLLNLIKYTYTVLDKVIYYKSDISAETSLMNITKGTLNIFSFLFDELKTINAQKERGEVVMGIINDITRSVTQILKKPAQILRMCAQGMDAAEHFSVGYLAEIKKANLAQTLTDIFDVLSSFKDEIFALQMHLWILELLQIWSEHDVLKEFFKQKVQNNKNDQEIQFREFLLGRLKSFKKEVNKPSSMENGSAKSSETKQELIAKVMGLLEVVCYNIYL